MKNIQLLLPVFFIMLIFSCKNEKASNFKNEPIMVNYPETFKDSTITDDYHGTQIDDPYRWLEDDHSDETKDWVTRQNKVSFGYLDKIPFRDDLKVRLEELWNYEKFSSPFKEGDYYYFFKNDGLQNQSVLYRLKNLGDKPELVLDPNTLSDDGTSSLGGLGYSNDGKYMAYQVSEGGSDWKSAYVKDLKSLDNTADKVEWIKFSGLSWYKDGFFYSRYPRPNENDELSAKNEFHALYYHKMGTEQSKDKLVYLDRENPQRNVYASVTDDEKVLAIYTSESTSGNALAVVDLEKEWTPKWLVEEFTSDYSIINHENGKLTVSTNNDAPNKKVIEIDLSNPQKSKWKELIAESTDALRGASVVGGKLFAYYLHDASSLVKVYEKEGTYIQDFELPGIGSTGGISGKADSNEAFFSFSSYTQPNTIYQLNTDDLKYEIFRKSNLKFDASQFETNQVWFTSKDGTKVPMFITHKKGLEYDGTAPTLLYGYGGFDIPLTPSFSVTNIPLLESGGIYVVANLRGGGEFGKEWHKAGTLGQKQNVFDDFQAAAEYLIDNKYTSSDKLAIEGGSNGGLLVGACITQRPDLYKVAFPAVGVLDMLRYHQFTIGWAWAGDYGRSDEADAFEYLIKYSPLHNVKEAAYPATMVTTADHDDRVVPAHSFKFISELQDKHNGENPVLIRIETSAGHGAGKPTSKIIEERADKLAFMLYNMDEKYPNKVE